MHGAERRGCDDGEIDRLPQARSTPSAFSCGVNEVGPGAVASVKGGVEHHDEVEEPDVASAREQHLRRRVEAQAGAGASLG